MALTIFAMVTAGIAGFTAQVASGSPRTAIINETMARRYFPDRSPLGQIIQNPHGKAEVVGIVADVHNQYRMALAALCGDDEWGQTWARVLQHRFRSAGEMHDHAVGNLLIVVFLSVFILLDKDRIIAYFNRLVPPRYSDEARLFETSVASSFGDFLRGHALIADALERVRELLTAGCRLTKVDPKELGLAKLTDDDVAVGGASHEPAYDTMTINGKMEVATLQETVTVTSQAPTIDLESSKVAVNWDQQKLDAHGRAYATGKRKNAVARVWLKRGHGKIVVNKKHRKIYAGIINRSAKVAGPGFQPSAGSSLASVVDVIDRTNAVVPIVL